MTKKEQKIKRKMIKFSKQENDSDLKFVLNMYLNCTEFNFVKEIYEKFKINKSQLIKLEQKLVY